MAKVTAGVGIRWRQSLEDGEGHPAAKPNSHLGMTISSQPHCGTVDGC
jgi:hypothetical protein